MYVNFYHDIGLADISRKSQDRLDCTRPSATQNFTQKPVTLEHQFKTQISDAENALSPLRVNGFVNS